MFLPLSIFSQTKLIEIESGEKSLESVLMTLENEYQLLLSYQMEDVKGVVVYTPKPPTFSTEFLKIILADTPLSVELIQDNFIIRLKDIPQKISSEQPADRTPSILCGVIKDQAAQMPLEFASVFLLGSTQGGTTNQAGRFELKCFPKENDTLVIRYVGYEEKRLLARDFLASDCPNVELTYLSFDQDFVVVTDYLTDGISLYDHGAYTKIKPNQLGQLPGQVEPEILETIHFLPGITAPDGSASNISIRGSTADQNLVLWENIPIYHTAHYFGMISAFNPYIMEKVSVYKSGFDASRGGKIAGVIDLKSYDQNMVTDQMMAGANSIHAYLNGRFSLANQKMAVVYSVRHSLTGLWRSPIYESLNKRIQQGELLQTSNAADIRITDAFDFFDSNLKGSYQFSKSDELNVAFFYGRNNFKSVIFDDNVQERQADTLDLQNMGGSINWTHHWNNQFSSNLIATSSDYNYDYFYELLTMSREKRRNGLKEGYIRENQLQWMNNYLLANKFKIDFGYHLNHYNIDFKINRESKNASKLDLSQTETALVHAVYSSLETPGNRKMGGKLGLRLSYFDRTEKAYFEPRLKLWYQLSDTWNFQLQAGRYHQFVSQILEIDRDDSNINTPVWAFIGEKNAPILTADQYFLGLVYHKKNWLIDLQFYQKFVKGLSTISLSFSEDFSNRTYLGNSVSTGVDVLLKKRWGDFRSWISYSYAKTNYKFPTFFDTDFLAPTDQRHVLRLANTWRIGSWDCSFGWKFSSGQPYARRENFEIVNDGNMQEENFSLDPLRDEFNDATLPFTHQLDASFLYHFLPKNTDKWKAVFGVSFLNIYNQRNVYKRSLLIDNRLQSQPELKYIDQAEMGFAPNFMVRFEW